MDALKAALTKEPILAYPDFTKPFILETDASNVGLGAKLSQIGDDGKEHPISYASRTLQKAEKNYATTEKEALAIVWACKHYRPYLYGRKFVIKSDHAPLRWLLTVDKPSPRLQRWGLALQEYNVEGIEYKPGPINKVPDALSRNPVPTETTESDQLVTMPSKQVGFFEEGSVGAVFVSFPGLPVNFQKMQREDPTLSSLIHYLESGVEPTVPGEKTFIRNHGSEYLLEKGILYHIPELTKQPSLQFPAQLVVPDSLKSHILELHHDDVFGGHLSVDKTLSRIRTRFHWDGMATDVKNHCAGCRLCHTKKHPHQYYEELLHPLPVSGAFDRVAVDVFGPLHITEKGNRFIVVFTCYLTKWPEAFAVPDVKATTIAQLFVEEIICRHGAPVELLSDCATNFLSALVAEVCKLCNTRKINTTPYHPACNALVEAIQ